MELHFPPICSNLGVERGGDISTMIGGGVLSSPWLRLYKVVGEIPGQSDLISGLIPAPAPASRLTQHSQSRPCQAVIKTQSHLTGQVQGGALSQLQEPGNILAGAGRLAVNLKIVEMCTVSSLLSPQHF